MNTDTLRRFLVVHTWAGLAAGIALFIAFFAGALTMLFGPIIAWERWEGAPRAVVSDAGVDRFVQAILAEHPDAAADLFVYLPAATGDVPFALGPRGEDGERGQWILEGDAVVPLSGHGFGEAADAINHVHFTLGLPESIGIWLMGLVSLVYGLALISGVVIHLPVIARDLFALRWTHNLKRLWQDAHNVIGVLSLPFHVIFAVTGVLLCALLVLVVGLNFGGMQGQAVPVFQRATQGLPPVEASGTPVPLPSLAALRARLADEAPGLTPIYLRFTHAGDAAGRVELRGPVPGHLAGESRVTFDARGETVLLRYVPGDRSAADLATRVVAALHFGTFGGPMLQGLYLVLGLAGAFLFYSGNLLWIESRRKRRDVLQPRHHRALAQLTVGTCVGCMVGVAAILIGAQLHPRAEFVPSGMDAYLLAFGASVVLAFVVAPWRGAVLLLGASAAAWALVPLLRVGLHGAVAPPAVWAVDGVALSIALASAWMARATWRRATFGATASVWARSGGKARG